MYAIVEIAGKQFRVSKQQNVKVPKLEGDSGSKVNFDKVLFYSDDSGKTQVGKPSINNLAVSATIVEHGRDKKIIVFRKKRRKGFQVKNGHRQGFSIIKIDDIGVQKGAATKTTVKAEPEVKTVPAAKTETAAKKQTPPAKTSAEKKTKPAAKQKTAATTTTKKAPAKKVADEKTAVKKPAEKKAAAKPKTAAKPKKAVKKDSDKGKEA